MNQKTKPATIEVNVTARLHVVNTDNQIIPPP